MQVSALCISLSYNTHCLRCSIVIFQKYIQFAWTYKTMIYVKGVILRSILPAKTLNMSGISNFIDLQTWALLFLKYLIKLFIFNNGWSFQGSPEMEVVQAKCENCPGVVADSLPDIFVILLLHT